MIWILLYMCCLDLLLIESAAGNTCESPDTCNQPDVPDIFKDPITNKIMLKPTVIVSSMQIYDYITIKKWIESEKYYDPITGIPLSVKEWGLLLEPLNNLKNKIEIFLKKYPSFISQVFNENDESIEWETLFKIHEEKIKDKYEPIAREQIALKIKAKQIFKPIKLEYDDEFRIEYEDKIILKPEIPLITFMGPSRNGKSTIINDILGVKEATSTSSKPNVALTRGAWIAWYVPTNDNLGFYLLDMEGLSHNVTNFTKRLFYACYATSNVVIWNDKNVASDEFMNLMNELQEEMKPVAESDRKPSFLYLKRDAGDYDFYPYDEFDEYINNDTSFEWFRKLNIFSSLSAYELDRPSRDRNNKKGGLNFHSKPENKALLVPLIEQIVELTASSKRFASTMFVLKQQIKHINAGNPLSMTKKRISDNQLLTLFLIAPKGDPFRRRDMIYVANTFSWDHHEMENKFNEEINKLQQTETETNKIDPQTIAALTNTKNEIYERIKNKIVHKTYGKDWGFTLGVGGTAVTLVTAAVAAPGIGAIVGLSAIFGGFGYLGGWVAGTVVEKTERIYTEKWKEGHYMKYTLGRTDEEIKLDAENAKKNTNQEELDDIQWDHWNQHNWF